MSIISSVSAVPLRLARRHSFSIVTSKWRRLAMPVRPSENVCERSTMACSRSSFSRATAMLTSVIWIRQWWAAPAMAIGVTSTACCRRGPGCWAVAPAAYKGKGALLSDCDSSDGKWLCSACCTADSTRPPRSAGYSANRSCPCAAACSMPLCLTIQLFHSTTCSRPRRKGAPPGTSSRGCALLMMSSLAHRAGDVAVDLVLQVVQGRDVEDEGDVAVDLVLLQYEIDVQHQHHGVGLAAAGGEDLVAGADVVDRQRTLQLMLEDVGQRADAGIEDDVADLAHGLLFHLRQLLQRHGLADHQADDFQAFILGEHEDGLGFEGALVVLADAADARVLVVAAPQQHGRGGAVHEADRRHRHRHFLVDDGAHRRGRLADADVEDFDQGVVFQFAQIEHVSPPLPGPPPVRRCAPR